MLNESSCFLTGDFPWDGPGATVLEVCWPPTPTGTAAGGGKEVTSAILNCSREQA